VVLLFKDLFSQTSGCVKARYGIQNADYAAEMLFVLGDELADSLLLVAAAFGVGQGSAQSVAC